MEQKEFFMNAEEYAEKSYEVETIKKLQMELTQATT